MIKPNENFAPTSIRVNYMAAEITIYGGTQEIELLTALAILPWQNIATCKRNLNVSKSLPNLPEKSLIESTHFLTPLQFVKVKTIQCKYWKDRFLLFFSPMQEGHLKKEKQRLQTRCKGDIVTIVEEQWGADSCPRMEVNGGSHI